MKQVTLGKIDVLRIKGFRPQVVGCFVFKKKLLFVFNKEHDLWQLPQGGIDNGENLIDAFGREMKEELGSDFADFDAKKAVIFGYDNVYFPPETQGRRNLITDEGKAVFMRGKYYFFIAIQTEKESIDIQKTQFDDYKWAGFDEALKLVATIYQKGKQRVTLKAVKKLRSKGYI